MGVERVITASPAGSAVETSAPQDTTKRCSMCGGLGWTLDCNDLSKPGGRMVEFMVCFHPECTVSGQPVESVCFKGVEFQCVSFHPSKGHVMSVSGPRVVTSSPDVPTADPQPKAIPKDTSWLDTRDEPVGVHQAHAEGWD